jgi:hypothetical protein
MVIDNVSVEMKNQMESFFSFVRFSLMWIAQPKIGMSDLNERAGVGEIIFYPFVSKPSNPCHRRFYC